MKYWKRQTSDPIRGLTHERLTAQIESYNNGYLAEFALTAEAMEQRDDILKNVIAKRKKAVTRHGWEILTGNCSPQARAQQQALDFFYRNLTVSHVLRKNESGGFQLLIYQMFDAIAKGYAVHEIVWKPQITGRATLLRSFSNNSRFNPGSSKLSPAFSASSACSALNNSSTDSTRSTVPASHLDLRTYNLTASFHFVPLWYFECATGRLRFLSTPGALHGEEMHERDWLITTGDALMIPCARAFLFKHAPLQAWLDYTSTYGLPGIRGITNALRGTPEFEEMENALARFMQELAVVTNSSESIDVLDLKGGGEPPFHRLVDRMDRVMASLWRGADLSTISRDRGYGASLQDQESRLLEQDDARSLSDHLHATLDRWVIDALFGPQTEMLARIKILVTPRECTPHDLAIDEFLLRSGARLSLSDTLERYGRVQAKPGEPALPSTAGEPFLGSTPVPGSGPGIAPKGSSQLAVQSSPPEPAKHHPSNTNLTLTPARNLTPNRNAIPSPPRHDEFDIINPKS